MIRVKMPDITEDRRWKRGRVETVKTQAQADDLVAQGGVILPNEPETEADIEPQPRADRAAPEPLTTTAGVKTLPTKAHK